MPVFVQRLQSVLIAVALAFAGCVEVNGVPAPYPADALDADWLDGASTIDAVHLGRILALGERDPEVAALFREAVKRLGGGHLEDFTGRFSPCPPTMGSESGFTSVKSLEAWIPRSLEDLALGKRSPSTDAELARFQSGRSRDVRVTTHADFIHAERTLLPEICIVARLPVVDAYEAIVHELVHALGMDPQAKTRLAAVARDKHAYDLSFVLLRGGEVEAYTVSGRARLRLGYRGTRVARIQPFFDPRTAQPALGQEALAEVILATPPKGLGYASGLLANAFDEARRELSAQRVAERSMLEQVLAERRANIGVFTTNVDVHTHNIAAHRHNLGVAAATGNQPLAAKSRAGLTAAERALADTRKLLEAARASEARLVGAVAGLE